MITLISSPADRALADRIAGDLRAAGYTVSDSVQPGREHVVVGLLSPDSARDPAFARAFEAANDFGQNMVVVQARPAEPPKNLDHLTPVDFTGSYAFDALRAQIDVLSGDHAPYAVRMQTSKVRSSNRRAGLVLGLIALVVFIIASIMIIFFDIESPAEEYEAVDTAVALTRDVMIGPTMQYLSTVLPRSTEAAEAFPATLDAIPTVLQPLFGATATSMHEQLSQFQSPQATGTPAADE